MNTSKQSEQHSMLTKVGDVLVVGPSGAASSGPEGGGQLDYVGNKRSMMKLFSLPYSDKSVSMGIHNVEGCLVIDAGPTLSEEYYEGDDIASRVKDQSSLRRERVKPEDPVGTFALQQSAALSTISSMIQKKRTESDDLSKTQADCQLLLRESNEVVETMDRNPSEDYLPWEFAGMKMLVGSSALVYRSTPEMSLAVRVEDAAEMRQQLKSHNQRFLRADQKQAQQKLSYAEALQSQQLIVQSEGSMTNDADSKKDEVSCMVHPTSHEPPVPKPEVPSFTLQTTIMPSTTLALGAKFAVCAEPPPATDLLSSPICTVIDAYLDQLITNVPQLALVLREKGFVQSVKLLQTEHIPLAFMQEKTFDTSSPFEVINLQDKGNTESMKATEQIFDVGVMKMNAASLLHFIRANCTKDNATYLLHREAGQTNIQLLDVTAISTQRQRKWIWWLAMMSYRFAQRLRHLSMHIGSVALLKPEDAALRRSFRARERSLLNNTLSLLEEFSDMGGQPHEMLAAEVCEKLADTFLRAHAEDESNTPVTDSDTHSTKNKPVPVASAAGGAQQRFGNVKPDALSKAQDYLMKGICVLRKVWSEVIDSIEKQSAPEHLQNTKAAGDETKLDDSSKVVSIDVDASSSDDEGDADVREIEVLRAKAESLAFQLYALQDKTIDIHLRLAEHHLNGYFSSSAMQALRNAARRMSDAVELLQAPSSRKKNATGKHHHCWKINLQIQFTRLWELCGHFARSFAADILWRERGHAAGDDVIGVLRDVQYAIPWHVSMGEQSNCSNSAVKVRSAEDVFFPFHGGLSEGWGDLYDLSGIVSTGHDMPKEAIEAAKRLLEGKRQLSRDRRRVLVAASVSYNRAVHAYEACIKFQQGGGLLPSESERLAEKPNGESEEFAILNLLRQRRGDANNELGKMLLEELRILLAAGQNLPSAGGDGKESTKELNLPTEPLLSSAQFWFEQGLDVFESSNDIRNSALLRCNICQCYKLRANASFATSSPPQRKIGSGASVRSAHADACLKEAISHLRMAHERIGQRDVDPGTWDMVSNELAATLLVLGVRRRQVLLAGVNSIALFQLRLSPGETKSIIDPMEKALLIYEQSGNAHHAAAVHYQLGLFFSKVWTCQRDEAKTREKLSAAFKHFNAALEFFSVSVRGNETTFVLLCLDLSNLYSTVSGKECLCQALLRCTDTIDAFSRDAIDRCGTGTPRSEWLKAMATLAASLEDRLFKTLRSLVKLEEETKDVETGMFKCIYRSALGAKMSPQTDDAPDDEKNLLAIHSILQVVKDSYLSSSQ